MSTQPVKPSAELLPCPFCGSKAIVECSENLGYWIECSKCVTTGPTHSDQSSAAEHWNRRNSSAPAQQGGNVGHGHVYPRPDGVKARCGGPTICKECALDFARKNAEQPKAQPSSAEVVAVAWRLSWTEKLGLRMVECFNRRDAAEAMRESKKKFGSHSFLTEPLYTAPISAVPSAMKSLIPELQAMCERWRDDYGIDDEWARGRKDCADELCALIDKHGKEEQP